MLVLLTSSGPFINQTRVELCVGGVNIDHCHAALHVHNRPSDRGAGASLSDNQSEILKFLETPNLTA